MGTDPIYLRATLSNGKWGLSPFIPKDAMNREQWTWMRASVALVAAAAAAMASAGRGNAAAEDMPALPEPIAGR